MTTKTLLFASLLCGFVSANAQESVATATYGNKTGNTTRTMTVALNHSTDYVAFYLDMTLPEGTTVKKATVKAPLVNGKTVNLSDKGGSATESTDFKVPFNQSGTNCKLVGYNYGNEKIGGASGDILLTLELETTAGVAYDATGVTAACTFVDADLAEQNLGNAVVTEARLWGDVVKDGNVDATDYQAVANIVTKLGNGSTAIDKFAADVDESDSVDATDYQAVGNIVTGTK